MKPLATKDTMNLAHKIGGTMATQKIIEHTSSGGGFAYFLGLIGAAVFYVQQVDGFWPIIGALLKACVWPAFVTYGVLKFIS